MPLFSIDIGDTKGKKSSQKSKCILDSSSDTEDVDEETESWSIEGENDTSDVVSV